MSRNLQTKKSSVYLQYMSTGRNVEVESSQSDLDGSAALIKITLVENQHTPQDQALQSISIDEQSVIDNFIEHVKSASVDVMTYQLALHTQEEAHSYTVTPTLTTQGDFRTLCFMVHTN